MLVAPDASILYILVIFGVAVVLLKNLFFEPISKVLDERAADIRQAAELHSRALEDAKRAVGEAEEKLGARRREAIATHNALRAAGQEARAKKQGDARREAERLLGDERKKLQEQIPSLKSSLREQAETLSREVANRILGQAA